jgi:hypothetical protein
MDRLRTMHPSRHHQHHSLARRQKLDILAGGIPFRDLCCVWLLGGFCATDPIPKPASIIDSIPVRILVPSHRHVLLVAALASQSPTVVCIRNIVCHRNHFEHYISLDNNFPATILLMAFPLAYLVLKVPGSDRPVLYYIQIGLMLLWLIILFLVDFVYTYDFRQTRWMVISYVVLAFAGMGGMIGVASLAGRAWTISLGILFLVVAILAFVQRTVTGI